jgi:hypothetical protein
VTLLGTAAQAKQHTFSGEAQMSATISVRAPAELVEELYTALSDLGVAVDEPQSAESASDAADAALGSKQIRTMLLLLTLAFNTASAGVALGDKLIDLKHKLADTELIELIHPNTGNIMGSIGQNTDDQAIRNLVFSVTQQ